MTNLIDLLDLHRGGRLYAAALAWLLDPGGEHGVGRAVLNDLAEVLKGTAWAREALAQADVEVRTSVRERRGRWDVVLSLSSGRVEILGGAASPDELDYDRGAGNVLHCLLPPPGAGQLTSDLPRWRWTHIAAAWQAATPHPRHASFLSDLAEHIRICVLPPRPVAALVEDTPATDESRVGDDDRQMVLSEDMSRAYQVNELLGQGGQGSVFDVRVMGNREFKDVGVDVRHAVLKLARTAQDDESILLEEAVYRTHGSNLARFLDSGVAGERRYLVLERLYPLPGQWFAPDGAVLRLDLATAIDVYFALLERLASLHFNKGQSVVLCDIKPDNVMLRLTSDGRRLDTKDYQRHLEQGAYEPVFADVGCAQDREVLRASGGRMNTLIGTPLYLAPESAPVANKDGQLQPGRYSPAADVYALSLTFYHYLTGSLPLAHRGLSELTTPEQLCDVLALKADGADPLDRALLYRIYDGAIAKDLEEVLDLGLQVDPTRRATIHALLNACRQKFGIREVERSALATQMSIDGLRQRQTRFPQLRNATETYRREARVATRRLGRKEKALT